MESSCRYVIYSIKLAAIFTQFPIRVGSASVPTRIRRAQRPALRWSRCAQPSRVILTVNPEPLNPEPVNGYVKLVTTR
jgi:hypothetical protein